MKSFYIAFVCIGLALAQYPPDFSNSQREVRTLSERAVPRTFRLLYSGADASRSSGSNNNGHAEGILVLDISQMPTGPFSNVPASAFISLDLTVTSPDYGVQHFTMADFSWWYFNSPIGLDYSRELMGQTTSDGRSFGNCFNGNCGDFNLFGQTSGAPYGIFYFDLAAGGNWNDALLLHSFAPAATCGNGIVEETEQCDGGACCTSTCTIASAGTVCRAAANSCDVPETCNGATVTCPADVLSNSTACFCGRQGLSDGQMGYYCTVNGGYYQCLGGVYASQSRAMKCGSGTQCACSYGTECSCSGTRSPCLRPNTPSTCA